MFSMSSLWRKERHAENASTGTRAIADERKRTVEVFELMGSIFIFRQSKRPLTFTTAARAKVPPKI